METTIGITRMADAMTKRDPEFMEFVQRAAVRFLQNEWGDCDKEDAAKNDEAPLWALGVYKYSGHIDLPEFVTTDRIWIKSDYYEDEDRRTILILFPDEY